MVRAIIVDTCYASLPHDHSPCLASFPSMHLVFCLLSDVIILLSFHHPLSSCSVILALFLTFSPSLFFSPSLGFLALPPLSLLFCLSVFHTSSLFSILSQQYQLAINSIMLGKHPDKKIVAFFAVTEMFNSYRISWGLKGVTPKQCASFATFKRAYYSFGKDIGLRSSKVSASLPTISSINFCTYRCCKKQVCLSV